LELLGVELGVNGRVRNNLLLVFSFRLWHWAALVVQRKLVVIAGIVWNPPTSCA
ncbi:hypothetical protein B296_00045982, partial [Ensete ventricosum]